MGLDAIVWLDYTYINPLVNLDIGNRWGNPALPGVGPKVQTVCIASCKVKVLERSVASR